MVFKTCGEISCDECNERYEAALKEIDRLTALIAERESTILRLQKDGHELLDAYEKKHKLFVDTNKILAERDAEIKLQKNPHRYNVMKQAIASQKRRIQELKYDIDLLEERLAASQQEVERLKAEVQSLQCPSYCAREADARKQAARECVEILRFYNGVEGIADQVMKKFGLEG